MKPCCRSIAPAQQTDLADSLRDCCSGFSQLIVASFGRLVGQYGRSGE
jgi:hypothetical protein